MEKPIWQPSENRISQANLTNYQDYLSDNYGLKFNDYRELHQWSIDNRAQFWASIWDFCDVIGDPGEQALINVNSILEDRFFPSASLNFAENLLQRQDHDDAMVFWAEDKTGQRVIWKELYDEVSRLRQALLELGIKPGDRVAAYMANTPQTVIAMLACTSLGATWCSCSPDFGEQGVIDRFEQISPTLLFAHTHYYYAGEQFDNTNNINGITKTLKTLNHIIIAPYGTDPVVENTSCAADKQCLYWHELLAPYQAQPIEFERFPFHHPLYILFSSGTTGMPKCIVHSAGGTLLQHLKEHQLHCDVKPNDRIFYYTTTSWMMWHWLVSGLASKATLLLYDGCPTHPNDSMLFMFADAEDMTLFGTSAKFIDTLAKNHARPAQVHSLESLRTITSTGSTLSPEHFDYVYQHIKGDVQLSSISGGSDIISCFVLGNPLQPVYRGEITCAGLGMAVEVHNTEDQAVQQEKGELVCTKAFPSMPIGFWNDTDHSKYHAAYFEKSPNIWAHGDFAERTERQGFIIHGRSDTTLNPGGVRIGSAEIYRQVEQIPCVLDCVVIAHQHQGDLQIILFVQLSEGSTLDMALIETIKQQIRTGTTAHHVPDLIYQVADVPRTRSGKIAELAVKATVEGNEVNNLNALANPEALDCYKNIVKQHHKKVIL